MSLPLPAGRPRDGELTERVLTEVVRHIMREGLPTFRIETIAQRALTTKPAIYRRWPNRIDLILDGIERVLSAGAVPDTGDLLSDLQEYAALTPYENAEPLDSGSARNFYCTVLNPEVLPRFMDRFGRERREVGLQVLETWVGRGVLPENLDGTLFLDTLLGVTVYRSLMTGDIVPPGQYQQLLEALVDKPPLLPRV